VTKVTNVTARPLFTQRSRDAITVILKMRHFTSEHYKVSKSDVFWKMKLQPISESLLMTCAKNRKNWGIYVKPIASQTWDIFETQCINGWTINKKQVLYHF